MSGLHTGIFGPGLHGKTTLAKFISRKNWLKHQRRTLSLDPYWDETELGEQAEVFGIEDEEKFWRRVWSTKGHLIMIDEATRMIGRDKDLIPFFNEIRHNHHKVVIIGHRAKAALLPDMRDQISTLFLFSQTPKSVDSWVEDFAQPKLKMAIGLEKYWFVHAEKGGAVFKHKLTDKERAL